MHYYMWLIQNPPILIYGDLDITPPGQGYFKLLNGTYFLLLNGQRLALL